MEYDGISFAHWQREGNLQTPLIMLSHDLTSDSQNTDPENYLAGSKNATADKKGKCKPECKPKRKKRNH